MVVSTALCPVREDEWVPGSCKCEWALTGAYTANSLHDLCRVLQDDFRLFCFVFCTVTAAVWEMRATRVAVVITKAGPRSLHGPCDRRRRKTQWGT